MRAPHNADLLNIRQLQKHFFHFAGVDIAPPCNDHILGTVMHRNIAVSVHAAHVSRHEPAVYKRLGAGLCVPPIARHNSIPAHHDLADFAAWKFHAIRPTDHDFNSRLRAPHRAKSLAPAWVAAVRHIVARQCRYAHRTLALPVNLQENGAKILNRLDDVGIIHRATCINDTAQALALHTRRFGSQRHPLDHCRRSKHMHAPKMSRQSEDFSLIKPA